MKKYLLETDLSEENWTRLPFKDDMLIHVKKAFSEGDRAGGKAPVLHSYGLICTYIQDITVMSKFAPERRVFCRLFNLFFLWSGECFVFDCL